MNTAGISGTAGDKRPTAFFAAASTSVGAILFERLRGLTAHAIVGLAAVFSAIQPTAGSPAAEPLVAIADAEEPQGLGLPSIARELTSFEQISTALEDEQRRISALESRLLDLEKRTPSGIEPLPSPAETATKDAAAKGEGEKEKEQRKPYEVGSDTEFGTAWANGLQAESANSDFRVKIGGRTQIDASAFSASPGPRQSPQQGGLDPALHDTVNVRRARLRIEGRMYEFYDWVAEYDFANQINVNNEVYPTEKDAGPLPSVTDLWLQMRELPILGTVRVGNQKDPYGYEHLTSSRWLNFMERSFSQDAFEGPFNGGFVPGIQSMNNAYDGRVAWQIGEFKATTNPFGFNNFNGSSMTVGRMVVLPVYEDEGRKLLHLGISGRALQPRDNQTRFRSRGSIRNSPSGPLNSIYADTGVLEATWQNMIGLEFVGNNGPWSFQSEYFGSWLYNAVTTKQGPYITNGYQPPPGTPVGTVYYQSGYAEVLYFLTGESRTYSLIESRFDRPIPRNNFYVVRGGRESKRMSISEGAWQVGARYNYLCLDNSGVNGGVLNGMTLGLNWLLNPNARIYFNYDLTYRNFSSVPWTSSGKPAQSYDGSGFINGFGTRLAFDF